MSPESTFVVNHFKSKKLYSRKLDPLSPKYQDQVKGIQSAIDEGYLRLRDNSIVATPKLMDTYFQPIKQHT